MRNRFETYWDGAEERQGALEEKVGQLEVEIAGIREFVEEAVELLRVAEFTEQGDYYDAQHLIAELDMYLEQPAP